MLKIKQRFSATWVVLTQEKQLDKNSEICGILNYLILISLFQTYFNNSSDSQEYHKE